MSIDWTNQGGTSYVTGPRNQRGSNFCWGFATTALIESMVRIQHGAWCARSEGDLFFGLGMYLFKGGDPSDASKFTVEHGLADPDCLPWMASEGNYAHPASAASDREGRTVRVPALEQISGVTSQKDWLNTIGPLTGMFEVWSDFEGFYANGIGVYRRSAMATFGGGTHVVCIVGYDDAQKCWIAKNSWGATISHPDAILRIGFGEVAIDTIPKYGLRWINPDPWTKRRHHAGGLFVSGNGSQRNNLELVVNGRGVFRHYFKEPAGVWIRVGDFGVGHPNVMGIVDSEVAATATTFERNFEVIGRFSPPSQNGPLQHWVFLQRLKAWFPTTPLGFGPPAAVGTPAFIQSNRRAPGDFELVVRNSSGSLTHLRRQHGAPWSAALGSWTQVAQFGGAALLGPTLLQARAGAWPRGEEGGGNLHLVFVTNAQRLEHWTFSYSFNSWIMVHEFGGGVTGDPQMIEGMVGGTEWSSGPLDLFVPIDDGVEHYRHDNPNRPALPWRRLSRFAGGIRTVIGVAQGHRGLWDYDLVLETSIRKLEHWVLTSTPTGIWKAAFQAKLP